MSRAVPNEAILYELVSNQKLSKANINKLFNLSDYYGWRYTLIIDHPSKVDTNIITENIIEMDAWGTYYVKQLLNVAVDRLSNEQKIRIIKESKEALIWLMRNRKLNSELIDTIIDERRTIYALLEYQYDKYHNITDEQLNRMFEIRVKGDEDYVATVYSTFKEHNAITSYIKGRYDNSPSRGKYMEEEIYRD